MNEYIFETHTLALSHIKKTGVFHNLKAYCLSILSQVIRHFVRK